MTPGSGITHGLKKNAAKVSSAALHEGRPRRQAGRKSRMAQKARNALASPLRSAIQPTVSILHGFHAHSSVSTTAATAECAAPA